MAFPPFVYNMELVWILAKNVRDTISDVSIAKKN